jgi:hypothetical protein
MVSPSHAAVPSALNSIDLNVNKRSLVLFSSSDAVAPVYRRLQQKARLRHIRHQHGRRREASWRPKGHINNNIIIIMISRYLLTTIRCTSLFVKLSTHLLALAPELQPPPRLAAATILRDVALESPSGLDPFLRIVIVLCAASWLYLGTVLHL